MHRHVAGCMHGAFERHNSCLKGRSATRALRKDSEYISVGLYGAGLLRTGAWQYAIYPLLPMVVLDLWL